MTGACTALLESQSYRFLFTVKRVLTVCFVGYLSQLWNDYQLRWESSDYGDIKVIRVPAEKVWKPDIVLFNKSVTSDFVLYYGLLVLSQYVVTSVRRATSCGNSTIQGRSIESRTRVQWQF